MLKGSSVLILNSCLKPHEKIVDMSEISAERSAERSDSFIENDDDFVKLFVGQVTLLSKKITIYHLETQITNELLCCK